MSKEEITIEMTEEFRNFLYERENAAATIQKYMTDIRTFFLFLGDNHMVDKPRVLAYKEWLLEHYAVSSTNSMLAALNQFFQYLHMDHLKIKRVRVQNSLFLREEKELTKEEYRKLVEEAIKEGKFQLALCMETIVSTGIRISELSYFTIESLKKEYIEILNKGKYRRIYIPHELKKKLMRFAKEQGICSGEIFVTRTGKPKSRSNIWREMKALNKFVGIDENKIFPHNLRHLFARVYYTSTKDLTGLGDLLGHSSLNVTRIYTANTGKMYQKQLDSIKGLSVEIK